MNSEAIVEGEVGERPAMANQLAVSRPASPPVLPEAALVRAAIMAPSPDNNQPWRFRFERGKLLLYEDRARRLPSDVCSMFSLLGSGAAVENVAVEASRHGLFAEVRCLAPGGTCGSSDGACAGDAPVAEICFSPGTAPDHLGAVLETRCTNRHAYSRQPVPSKALNQMSAAATRFDGCHVTWLTDRASIRGISKLVAAADRVRFECAEFHAELFRQLRLTPGEAERTRDGLDLRTLGLPSGGGLLLRSLRSWPLVQALNHIGLSRMLTLSSAVLVRKSGALGALTVTAPANAAFFEAGRALERLWLTATELGLSLHPLGSLPIFVGHHELLGGRSLDVRHARLAVCLSRDLHDVLPAIRGQTLVMIFRLGTSTARPVRSFRRTVEEVMKPCSTSPPLEANEALP